MTNFKVDYKTYGEKVTTFKDFLTRAGDLGITESGIREIIGKLYYLINEYRLFSLLNK